MNELTAEYAKAADLDRKIKVSAQLAQQSLYDMCMGLKEMRDNKLYKELGQGLIHIRQKMLYNRTASKN